MIWIGLIVYDSLFYAFVTLLLCMIIMASTYIEIDRIYDNTADLSFNGYLKALDRKYNVGFGVWEATSSFNSVQYI